MSRTSQTPWRSISSRERARIRSAQLQKVEQEMMLEEKEALKMTEEQRQALLSSFALVKTEFYDLDGLSWSESSSCEYMGDLSDSASSESILNRRAPSEITNSPTLGPRSPIDRFTSRSGLKPKRQFSAGSKNKSKRSPNSRGSKIRAETPVQRQRPFLTLAIPLKRDGNATICPDNYRPLPPTPTSAGSTIIGLSPNPQEAQAHCRSLPATPPNSAFPSSPCIPPTAPNTPASPGFPRILYAAGVPLTRFPSAALRTGRLISISGQPQPVGPRAAPSSKESVFSHKAGHDKWARSVHTLGLGRPGIKSGDCLGQAEENVKGSHLEMSKAFDIDIDIENLPPVSAQLSSSISGLPSSSSVMAQGSSLGIRSSGASVKVPLIFSSIMTSAPLSMINSPSLENGKICTSISGLPDAGSFVVQWSSPRIPSSHGTVQKAARISSLNIALAVLPATPLNSPFLETSTPDTSASPYAASNWRHGSDVPENLSPGDVNALRTSGLDLECVDASGLTVKTGAHSDILNSSSSKNSNSLSHLDLAVDASIMWPLSPDLTGWRACDFPISGSDFSVGSLSCSVSSSVSGSVFEEKAGGE